MSKTRNAIDREIETCSSCKLVVSCCRDLEFLLTCGQSMMYIHMSVANWCMDYVIWQDNEIYTNILNPYRIKAFGARSSGGSFRVEYHQKTARILICAEIVMLYRGSKSDLCRKVLMGFIECLGDKRRSGECSTVNQPFSTLVSLNLFDNRHVEGRTNVKRQIVMEGGQSCECWRFE